MRVISQRLIVRRGQPPEVVDEYKRSVVSMYMGVGTRQRERAAVLLSTATGDWRNRKAFEVYVGAGEELAEAHIVKSLVNEFTWAVAGEVSRHQPEASVGWRRRLARRDRLA